MTLRNISVIIIITKLRLQTAHFIVIADDTRIKIFNLYAIDPKKAYTWRPQSLCPRIPIPSTTTHLHLWLPRAIPDIRNGSWLLGELFLLVARCQCNNTYWLFILIDLHQKQGLVCLSFHILH